MADHATTPESVSATAAAIAQVAKGNHFMFWTPATRDALVSMAAYATTDVAVHDVTTAIFRVIQNDDDAAKLFGVPSMRDALVHIKAEQLTTAESVCRTATTMLLVAQGKKEIFQTPMTRDAIVSMTAYATTEEAVEAVTTLLAIIIHDDDAAAKVFGVPSVWDALFRMALRVRTLRTGYTVVVVMMGLLRANVRMLGMPYAMAKFSLFAVCYLASYVSFSLLCSVWTTMLEIVAIHV
jgi:hypothetical protein